MVNMANMKECSGSGRHVFDTNTHSTCPVCGAPPVGGMPKSQGKMIVPWVIAVLSIVIAGMCFFFMNQTKQQLNEQSEKYSQLEKNYNSYRNKYADFEKMYGYGSNDYRASQSVIILDAGGSSKEFYIYATEKYQGKSKLKESNNKLFSADWSGNWDKNWKKIIVAPGKTRGMYTIRFWNEADTVAFNVLVIIK